MSAGWRRTPTNHGFDRGRRRRGDQVWKEAAPLPPNLDLIIYRFGSDFFEINIVLVPVRMVSPKVLGRFDLLPYIFLPN
jgi:hypothetical protein